MNLNFRSGADDEVSLVTGHMAGKRQRHCRTEQPTVVRKNHQNVVRVGLAEAWMKHKGADLALASLPSDGGSLTRETATELL